MTPLHTSLLGLGCLFGLSTLYSVALPLNSLGKIGPSFQNEDGVVSELHPLPSEGLVERGRSVYVSEGCQACHTQIVRGGLTYDLSFGWGERRTVYRDYLGSSQTPFGFARLGPDLANYGASSWRNEPKDDLLRPKARDTTYLIEHLANPRTAAPHSVMPSYPHLFLQSKQAGSLRLTEDGVALVWYLKSLNKSYPLEETSRVSLGKK